jgi:ATP-dependent DNA helicase RecQ
MSKVLQQVLEALTPNEPVDQLLDRLRHFQQGEGVWGHGDAAALLAQVLRRQLARNGQTDVSYKVCGPLASLSDESLRRCHLGRIRTEGGMVVTASAWKPCWVDGTQDYCINRDALIGEKRRTFESLPPDPFLSRLGLEKYRCIGQREAVRAALTMPEGATLLVNLPTGAGKSLLAQLPCVMDTEALTVVIVPTTALCIDQERALREATERTNDPISHSTAFYGSDQDRRSEIRRRIAEGSQRVVFASPEAVCGRLGSALHKAAQRIGSGQLRWLIIDEAHMIEQWGGSFRPEFQALAGFRSSLLRTANGASLRTLLLSATVTPDCIDGLKKIFGKPGPFKCVSAVQLRPEPSCWVAKCESEQQRTDRTLEAVFNLPRPLILYTTKISDAERWHQLLQESGLNRIGMVIGKTSDEDRRTVIDNLRGNKIEIVVANSAFGLGVDAEVRSVVHACVPDNLDRYYQEIGRGGRDGLASISMVLYTADDLTVAEKMNSKPAIGIERGLARWQRMFHQKDDLGEGRCIVHMNAGANQNQRHLEWDNHTLNLLARAGVIELDWQPPPPAAEGATPDERERNYREHKQTRTIRLLHQQPIAKETWTTCVDPERQRVLKSFTQGFKLMKEALRGERCLAEVASDLYASPGQSLTDEEAITVAKSCGGCPACRQQACPPWADPMPMPAPPWSMNSTGIRDSLTRMLQHGSAAIHFGRNDEPSRSTDLVDILDWLVAGGLHFVVAPTQLLEVWRPRDRKSSPVFVSRGRPHTASLSVPSLIVHPTGEIAPDDLYGLNIACKGYGILMYRDDTITSAGRLLREVIRIPSFGLDQVMVEWKGG